MAIDLTNPYIIAAGIVLATVMGARALQFIVAEVARRQAASTDHPSEDMVLHNAGGPLYAIVVVGGIFLALHQLPAVAPYLTLLNQVTFAIMAFLIALLISNIITMLVRRWLRVRRQFQRTPELLNKFITVIIYIIAILIVLARFDINITPLVTALGLGGLAVGLALQSTLSNFFAGLHIISERPINVGDYVKLPQEQMEGYVEDVGWRSTRIRTLPNNIVIVPNAYLADSVIENTYLPQKEMAVLVQVGVAHYSDLQQVEEVTIEVARQIQKEVQGGKADFDPFIRYHTFGDSNIQFTVILRVHEYIDRYLVTHEFVKALQKRYAEEGIEISWPVRKIFYGSDEEDETKA